MRNASSGPIIASTPDCDAVVVGASLAGCTTAKVSGRWLAT